MKELLRSLNDYKKELAELEKELQILPQGSLIKRKNTYTHKIEKKEIVITKTPELICQLCRKKFLQAWKKQYEYNLAIFGGKKGDYDQRTLKQIIQQLPPFYQDIPQEYFYHPTVKNWLNQDYQKNKYKEENLIYTTNNGIRVRSKSEQLIANTLEEMGLPYRYDIQLPLKSVKIYPDFTIINPFNGKIFIWEHFGALNQPDYIENMNKKMTLYREKGYAETDRIIYTFESDIRDPQHLKNLINKKIL